MPFFFFFARQYFKSGYVLCTLLDNNHVEVIYIRVFIYLFKNGFWLFMRSLGLKIF